MLKRVLSSAVLSSLTAQAHLSKVKLTTKYNILANVRSA